MQFKDFLLNEEKAYLSHKVSDVLTALHDLNGDLENLGSRQLNRMAEAIVNQIRRILHSQWSDKQIKHLKALQKSAVAIMKAIDEKGDLKSTLQGAAQELEGLSSSLGEPVSSIDAKGEPAKLKKPEKAPKPEMPQAPPEQSQQIPQTGPPGDMQGQMPGATLPPGPMPQQGMQGAA